MMTTIFLSAPYTHPDPVVIIERLRLTEDCCAWLHHEGLLPMSPIVHWHHVAIRHGLPTEAMAWTDWNRQWVRASDAVACLHLDGWENSIGMAMECEWARAAGKPIKIIKMDGQRFRWA